MSDENHTSGHSDPDLDIARSIIRHHLPATMARLWLFGSRARGDARRWSDIDVAVEPVEPFGNLPSGCLAETREALQESNILLNVDLVDLSQADEALRASVRKDGMAWNG